MERRGHTLVGDSRRAALTVWSRRDCGPGTQPWFKVAFQRDDDPCRRGSGGTGSDQLEAGWQHQAGSLPWSAGTVTSTLVRSGNPLLYSGANHCATTKCFLFLIPVSNAFRLCIHSVGDAI